MLNFNDFDDSKQKLFDITESSIGVGVQGIESISFTKQSMRGDLISF